jgi:transposase
MEQYVGLDVSLEETAVCIVDSTGAVVREGVVSSDPGAIGRFLEAYRGKVKRVGLEAGGLSPWLWHGLDGLGWPAICIESRRMHAFAKASPVKTDRRDARLIAQAVRAGMFVRVHVKSADSQRLRMLLTSRQALLGAARRLQVKLRGDLRPFGIKLGKVGSGGFAGRVRARLGERPELLALAEPVLLARAALLAQLRVLDRQLRQAAHADAVCRRLMTAPGVGPVVALGFRSGVDSLTRFPRARAVAALFGLTPRVHQSGEVDRAGAISKAGDPMVRSLLFEAANALLTRTKGFSALKRWGVKIAQRRGMNRARVAVARRLAVILLAMWREDADFRWSAAPTA